MKKSIVNRIREKIALNEKDYADNYIARWVNAQIDTPEAKKQVELADENMPKIEDRIKSLKKLEKELNAKSK